MLTPSLNTVMTRLLIVAAVLAAIVFFAPAIFAQVAEENMISYAEDRTDAVRTFTSTDPENGTAGAGIDWDVTGTDADDFSIDARGMLMFNSQPDYENPTDRANDRGTIATDDDHNAGMNTYEITVRATEQVTDGADVRALSTETDLTVMVTDVDEPGMVMMNRIQPEVGTPITAMLTDPDNGNQTAVQLDTAGTVGTDDDAVTLGWTWYVSKVTDPVDDVESHWIEVGTQPTDTGTSSSYTPVGDRVTVDTSTAMDEDKYLRAVVMYLDMGVEDSAATPSMVRKQIGVSLNPVRKEVTSDSDTNIENPENGSPGFSSAGDYTREIPENTAKGMPVGAKIEAIDPNSDTLTYELDDDVDGTTAVLLQTTDTTPPVPTDVSFFSIDDATGQLMVKNTLDYDANMDGYEFYVRAIDPSGETAVVMVTVTTTDTNDAPKIMGSKLTTDTGDTPPASSELRANEQDSDDDSYTGAPNMLLLAEENAGLGQPNVFTAMDEDARGQIFWDLEGEDADDFDLSSSSDDPTTGLSGPNEPIALRFKTAPDFENPTDSNNDSVYKVTLVARDSRGATDMRSITVFVDNVEEKGKATLDEDQPLIGQTVTASVEDPDNGVAIVTWRWERATSTAEAADWEVIPGATIGTYTPVGVDNKKTDRNENDNGFYLRATATYTDITSNPDVMGTTGFDERTQTSATVARTATGTDGTGDDDKVYRVMAVSKNAVRVGPDPDPTVDPPQFAMSSNDRMVVENAEAESIVGDPVRVVPELDDDGDPKTTFSYDLKATVTGDNDYFYIGTTTGQIRVKAVDFPDPVPADVMENCGGDNPATCPDMVDPTLDYEGANTFSLIVTAKDDNNPSRTTVTTVNVSLMNLNEIPYFDKATREAVTGENSPIMYGEQRTNAVVQLSGVEPDGHTLKWEVIGADASAFMIMDADDLDDGKDRVHLMFDIDPDYENGKGSVEGTVAGDTYTVMVRATEMMAVGDGPKMAAEQMVTVQVTNAKEAGMVDFTLLQPEVGTAITASVTDLDNAVDTGQNWTWYRAKVSNPNRNPDPDKLDSEWLQITGGGANTAAYTPQGVVRADDGTTTGTRADEDLFLLARVTYNDGYTGAATTTAAVGITAYPTRADVSDAMNNSPDFNDNKTTREVPESTAVGMPVGDPVDVDRNEDGDVLTYSLDNDDQVSTPLDLEDNNDNPTAVSFFSIDQATGQIMVKNPLSAEMTDGRTYTGADAATPGTYVLFVRATDPSGEADGEQNSDEIEVTITAADVNEAPVVSGMAELMVDEADSSNKNRYVGLGSTEDSDGNITENSETNTTNVYRRNEEDAVDRATWPEPIAGPDGDLFEYSVHTDGISRRLHFITPPNYEDPMDADGDNVYEVVIRAVDTGGAMGEKAVRITVMNVDEKGKLALSPDQPDDGMPVIATLTDPDGVVQITNWKWYSNNSRDRDSGTTIEIEGATMSEYTGDVGDFLWAMVEYRDGENVVDDVVTVLDERNASSTVDTITNHDSDRMLETGTKNAVQADPDPPTDPDPTDTGVVAIERMVYENVPSTGYVGDPITKLASRNMIGGPDGATFEFAEVKDGDGDGYYDDSLQGPTVGGADVDDKMGQLALVPVTHLDHEAKDTYIIEITDPDSAVDISTYRVTIMVMDVNEAPTPPSELKGLPPVLNTAPMFAATSTSLSVDENAAAGTVVGMVTATDADRGDQDTLVYTLGGADAGSFSIDSATGEITTTAMLDYEMQDSYMVMVTATDDDEATDMIYVTIMVNDLGLDNAYDMDEDGKIDIGEAIMAVQDFFAGRASLADAIAAVQLYFAGLAG